MSAIMGRYVRDSGMTEGAELCPECANTLDRHSSSRGRHDVTLLWIYGVFTYTVQGAAQCWTRRLCGISTWRRDTMAEIEETVLVGWARDADGGTQRFTGEDIDNRAGVWCMDRLRRGIPTVSTFYCTVHGLHFTSELAVVPMSVSPVMRLRKPDEINQLTDTFVIMAYKRPEDG